MADELKRNEKERAEHVMLVDLGRNDLGRVCGYGTVRVTTFMALERYSHVMHMVSVVEGQLADEYDRLDALVAVFPGGHDVGRAEDPRDADHRRAGAGRAAASMRGRRLSRFRRQPGFLHRHPHDSCSSAGMRTCRPARASSRTRIRRRSTRRRRDKARAMVRALELAMEGVADMVLVIDNYDSFTYNLVQYLGELGAEVKVRRNDAISIDEIEMLRAGADPDLARARAAGGRRHHARRHPPVRRRRCRSWASASAIRRSGWRSAAQVVRAPVPMHGKTSTVEHDGKGCSPASGVVSGVAVSLAGDGRSRLAGRARDLRALQGRRAGHGAAASRMAAARRAVSSRVDPDARGPAHAAELPRDVA